MDFTLKIILEKISQITERLNILSQKSRKIHELNDLESVETLYIAATDGVNTGKVKYISVGISQEEFDRIANLQLVSDTDTSSLQILDKNNDVITSLDISFLNGNSVTLSVNHEDKRLELLNFNDEVISAVDLSELFPEAKQKQIFTHTLTDTDIVNDDVKLDLPNNPNIRDWYDLHINTSWVKPGSYEIINDFQLVIYGDRLPYSLKAGAEVIFQYTYTDV